MAVMAIFRSCDSCSECNVLFFYLESRLQFDFELFLCSLRSLFLVFRSDLFLLPLNAMLLLGSTWFDAFRDFRGRGPQIL